MLRLIAVCLLRKLRHTDYDAAIQVFITCGCRAAFATMSQKSEESGVSQELDGDQRELLVVEQVHNYPVLYDKSTKGHRNRNKRQKAFSKIATKLKMQGMHDVYAF